MLAPEEIASIDRNVKVMKAVWFAMAASVGIYAAMPSILLSTGFEPLGLAEVPVLRMALAGASVITALSTVFIYGAVIRGAGQPARPGLSMAEAVAIANKRHMSAMVVALALCESMAVYGLVLFFLGDASQAIYVFMTGSALLMLRYRPSRETAEMLAEGIRRGGQEGGLRP